MTLVHHKQNILDYITTERSDPQNYRLYKVINDPNIKLKRLLKDMVKEGLITIHFEDHKGQIKRILTKQRDCINYE